MGKNCIEYFRKMRILKLFCLLVLILGVQSRLNRQEKDEQKLILKSDDDDELQESHNEIMKKGRSHLRNKVRHKNKKKGKKNLEEKEHVPISEEESESTENEYSNNKNDSIAKEYGAPREHGYYHADNGLIKLDKKIGKIIDQNHNSSSEEEDENDNSGTGNNKYRGKKDKRKGRRHKHEKIANRSGEDDFSTDLDSNEKKVKNRMCLFISYKEYCVGRKISVKKKKEENSDASETSETSDSE